jgi:hypothetical protein
MAMTGQDIVQAIVPGTCRLNVHSQLPFIVRGTRWALVQFYS